MENDWSPETDCLSTCSHLDSWQLVSIHGDHLLAFCVFFVHVVCTQVFISAESEEDMTRGECWSHFQWVSMLTFLLSGLKAKLYIWTSFSGCVPEMDPYGLKKAIRHSNYSKRQLPNKRVYWQLLWNARVVDNFVYFVCIVYVGPHHWNGRKTRHSMNG